MTDTTSTGGAVSWKEKLRGSFDLIFMFGRGIAPFEKDNSKAAALQSLWIPALFFPLSFYFAYTWPPEGLEHQPMRTVMIINGASYIIGFVAGLGLLWVAAMAFNRRDRFWLTFQAGNWIGIPLSLVSLPFFILAVAGWYPRAQMDHVFTVITYYGVFVNACVFFRGLKIDWAFGGFLACLGVFIGQQVWNLLFWLNDVPIKWY